MSRLALCFALAACLAVSGCGNTPTKPQVAVQPPDSATEPPAATPDPPVPTGANFLGKPDYLLTAEELVQEFSADREAANKKFKGKLVRVTGVVESTNVEDSVTVTMKGDGKLPLRGTVLGYEKDEVMKLKPGQAVMIQAVCREMSAEDKHVAINAGSLGK